MRHVRVGIPVARVTVVVESAFRLFFNIIVVLPGQLVKDGFTVHDRSLKQPSAEFIDFFLVECVIIRAFALRIRVPDYVFPQTFIDID